jgi:hypothetical protein
MDYDRERFLREYGMHQPVQSMYLTELEYERDMDRMKELYPRSVNNIVRLVDEACDRFAYEGSLMYDEYPDRLMIERIVESIFKEALDGLGCEDMPEPGTLKDLIWVILNNEMYRRRCRNRRYRRFW